MRIEKSAALNKQRIKKMAVRNQLVETIFGDCKKQMKTYFESNPDVYKKLLKDLIVQSLIRLMESEVYVMCRKSDESIVNSVLDEAAADYKKLMAEKVKKLEGKEPPLNI